MISVRGDAVVIEYDRPAMDAALANDPRRSQVTNHLTPYRTYYCVVYFGIYSVVICSYITCNSACTSSESVSPCLSIFGDLSTESRTAKILTTLRHRHFIILHHVQGMHPSAPDTFHPAPEPHEFK